MQQDSQDRNLPASERKLQRAVDDGQVTRSRDMLHLAVLGAGSLALLALAPALFARLKLDLSRQLSFDASTLAQSGSMLTRLQDMVVASLIACSVFALIVSVAVVLSGLAVGGWVSSLKPLMPDFSRLNPLSGLGRRSTAARPSTPPLRTPHAWPRSLPPDG
jgi:flagellar biosynthetic protein FlhB